MSLFTLWMTDSRLDLVQASVSKHIFSVAMVNDLSDLTLRIRREGKILSQCSWMSLTYFLLLFSRVFWIRMAKGASIDAQMTYRLACVPCVGMIHCSSPVPFITSRPNPQLLETISPKLFKHISVQQTQIQKQIVSLLDVFIPGALRQAPAPLTSSCSACVRWHPQPGGKRGCWVLWEGHS